MKSTPQTAQPSSRPNFPPIDYLYHSTIETSHAPPQERRGARELRGFWKLSNAFFGGEAKLAYATELLLFGVITTVSAWPIISTVVAITRMVRNY